MKKPLNTEGYHPVDAHVGSRIRLRRSLLVMSQQHLAKTLGLTFQQVQKYERGHNRVSASRLYDISRVLKVPVSFFFEDIPQAVKIQVAQQHQGLADSGSETDREFETDPLSKSETLELVRAYYHIKNKDVRRSVYELCRNIARSHRLGPGRPARDDF